jgi:hypothetical protein
VIDAGGFVDFGAPPAELVWFVSEKTDGYDCMIHRAMTAELWLGAAFTGRQRGNLWYSDRFFDRHETWSRAAQALLGADFNPGE